MSTRKPLVLVERDGPLATLTLNRTEKRNAMSSELTREAKSAIAELVEAEGLRVLIIEGAGGVFSAGADVVEMGALTEGTARDFISNLHSLIRCVREFPHPVVCKCQGYVLGGALELMLGCDLRVAADDTKFGMPEVRVGVPSVIEAALFAPFCGLGAAQDLLLTGRTFDAQEAHRLGIVQRICPQSDLEKTTRGAVMELLQAAPGALSAQKALLRRWMQAYLEAAVPPSIDAFEASFRTGEPQEGMAAAHEKRPPAWAPGEG
ncbi:MAG: enoyl-CoA hydratase-related protein [Nitrospinae bacterium]|nr:enoyl-CoA hydratase-related protein [Nitrospinota bacterium]